VDNAAIFSRGLSRTVRRLRAAHKKVVLVGPVPPVGKPVPQLLAHLALSGERHPVALPAAAYHRRERVVLPLIRRLAEAEGVQAVFPASYLCHDGRCRVSESGIPLYRDGHHLSVYGAMKLVPLLQGIFL
jgi:hypothetical protein